MRVVVLAALCGGLYAQVAFVRDHDRIDVTVDGRPFTSCHFEAENNKPYLHPLRSASGKVLTRGYPMENIAGEATDHPHHRGVGLTHGDVNGLNFWASEPAQAGPTQGRILLDKVEKMAPGRRRGEIVASFRWVEPSGTTLLRERRTMTFYAHSTLRIVDFDIELRAQSRAVHFGDTKEGSFYLRLGTALSEEGGGRMVNANGQATEQNVWGKRADWLDDSGVVDGERIGVAVFDHPGNPRHPPYWHSRGYGLIAANIFGWRDFLNDPTQDGGLTLQPGQVLRFRYRVVVHPGDAAEAGLDALYRQYAGVKGTTK